MKKMSLSRPSSLQILSPHSPKSPSPPIYPSQITLPPYLSIPNHPPPLSIHPKSPSPPIYPSQITLPNPSMPNHPSLSTHPKSSFPIHSSHSTSIQTLPFHTISHNPSLQSIPPQYISPLIIPHSPTPPPKLLLTKITPLLPPNHPPFPSTHLCRDHLYVQTRLLARATDQLDGVVQTALVRQGVENLRGKRV